MKALYGWAFWLGFLVIAVAWLGVKWANRPGQNVCGHIKRTGPSTFVCNRPAHPGSLHWDGRFMWDDDGPVRSITPPELQSDCTNPSPDGGR